MVARIESEIVNFSKIESFLFEPALPKNCEPEESPPPIAPEIVPSLSFCIKTTTVMIIDIIIKITAIAICQAVTVFPPSSKFTSI